MFAHETHLNAYSTAVAGNAETESGESNEASLNAEKLVISPSTLLPESPQPVAPNIANVSPVKKHSTKKQHRGARTERVFLKTRSYIAQEEGNGSTIILEQFDQQRDVCVCYKFIDPFLVQMATLF